MTECRFSFCHSRILETSTSGRRAAAGCSFELTEQAWGPLILGRSQRQIKGEIGGLFASLGLASWRWPGSGTTDNRSDHRKKRRRRKLPGDVQLLPVVTVQGRYLIILTYMITPYNIQIEIFLDPLDYHENAFYYYMSIYHSI